MEYYAEILISVLLVLAGLFGLLGSFGLLKLPNTMARLHAPTKAATIGIGGVLLASMAYFWVFKGMLSWHELLITLFILLTAPITANFIAKAWLHTNADAKILPETGSPREWATFDEDDEPVQPDLTTVPKP